MTFRLSLAIGLSFAFLLCSCEMPLDKIDSRDPVLERETIIFADGAKVNFRRGFHQAQWPPENESAFVFGSCSIAGIKLIYGHTISSFLQYMNPDVDLFNFASNGFSFAISREQFAALCSHGFAPRIALFFFGMAEPPLEGKNLSGEEEIDKAIRDLLATKEAVQNECDGRGVHCLFVLQPTKAREEEGGTRSKNALLFYQKLLPLVPDEDILDLSALLENEDYIDSEHYSPEGNRKIALALSYYIRSLAP